MRRLRLAALIFLVICTSLPMVSQSKVPGQDSDPFEDFFQNTAFGNHTYDTAFMKLVDSVGTMPPAEITNGIAAIDGQLDNTTKPENSPARACAALLLMYISWRPDGAELLASQMGRLTSMLNEPSHLRSSPAAQAFQHIGITRSTVVAPILEAALKQPEVNNATSVGPGIAVILLRMVPHDDEATQDIVEYMRRADLTDNQLISTIVGIESSPVKPDSLIGEVVRCLDRPDEHVKIRALMTIYQSSPSAREAARTRIQKMANDPNETARIGRLAAEVLDGNVTENPEISK